MDVFGSNWDRHREKIFDAWQSLVSPSDCVLVPGDICWAMYLEDAVDDLNSIAELNGTKILIRGNHDYWWNTAAKMERFFAENGLTTMEILHNNCRFYGDVALCGTRGWFFEEDQKPHNAKVLNREVGRLETSLKAAEGRSIFCFLHYPPLYQGYECPEILRLLREYGVKVCCYGHLHGASHRRALQGDRGGTAFCMVSGDYLGFHPKKICD